MNQCSKDKQKGKKSPAYLCSPSTLSLRSYLSSSLDHRNPSPESFSAQAQLAKMATSTKSPATSLRNILQENHKDSSNAQKKFFFFSFFFLLESRTEPDIRTSAHTRPDRPDNFRFPSFSQLSRAWCSVLSHKKRDVLGVYVSS